MNLIKNNFYQSSNSPYLKLIKEESEIFYKASLLIPEQKRLISWALYCFWKELTPFEYLNCSQEQNRFISKWKNILFFENNYEENLSISLTAWLDLQYYFNENTENLILQLLNNLEICQLQIKFPFFEELQYFLSSISSPIGLISVYILFYHNQNTETNTEINNEIILSVNYLSMGILWWELLKQTNLNIDSGKIFIPSSDFLKFNCSEKNLTQKENLQNIKLLTQFELNKNLEYFKLSINFLNYKTNINLPKSLREIILFLNNYYSEEIKDKLKSNRTFLDKVNSSQNQKQKQNSSNWLLNGLDKWVKK